MRLRLPPMENELIRLRPAHPRNGMLLSAIAKWLMGGGNCAAPTGDSDDFFGFEWATYILPYMEFSTVYDHFDLKPKGGGEYAKGGQRRLLSSVLF